MGELLPRALTQFLAEFRLIWLIQQFKFAQVVLMKLPDLIMFSVKERRFQVSDKVLKLKMQASFETLCKLHKSALPG